MIVDRDGVLNREAANGGWVGQPGDWAWEKGALEGLRLLTEAGLHISIVTNQSGVGRGLLAAEDVAAVHRHMLDEAHENGCRIDRVLVCPHAPDEGCRCRKPAPGLIEDAIEAAGVGVGETIVVGDAERDLQAATAAGVEAVLVRTGKGRTTERQLDGSGCDVYDDLAAAARAILKTGQRGTAMSIQETFDEHAGVMAAASQQLEASLNELIELVVSCLRAGHKILVCGNGGSAADAQHLAAELVCRFAFDRRALPALALTTDTSALTAIANDLGYDQVFARQIEAIAVEGDVLVAISTSGRSPNVLEAARVARSAGCGVVAMTGSEGGALAELADLVIAAPSRNVARIQEVHGIVVHILAESAEAALCGAEDS
ncbi:MAG: HAD-IIIA family hydrolase [Acidobacteriota bacterium]